MKQNLFPAIMRPLGLLCLGVMLAACGSSNKNPGLTDDDQPVGGTPAELAFQYAQAIAKNGNCDQALPVLICLGEQGRGWELAQHSGGMCALDAAKVWTGPLQKRDGYYAKTSKVSYDKPYYKTKDSLREKGLTLLRSTAGAGWPDSQAALALELGAAGNSAAQWQEARFWLTRYDRNARRKIYGTNILGPDVRARLAQSPLPPPDDAAWTLRNLVKLDEQDQFCQQLVRGRPNRPEAQDAPAPSDLPPPETVDGR